MHDAFKPRLFHSRGANIQIRNWRTTCWRSGWAERAQGRSRTADALTYFLTALLSSVVHDNWGVDEGAGGGHVLSEQAFHFVRTQTDGQVEELHWSRNEWGDKFRLHLNLKQIQAQPCWILKVNLADVSQEEQSECLMLLCTTWGQIWLDLKC